MARKLTVAYIIPNLSRQAGWRTHTVGLIQALEEWIKPVLFVAESDQEEANQLFPRKRVFTLPVTQSAWMYNFRGIVHLARCYTEIWKQSRSGVTSHGVSSLGESSLSEASPVDIVHSLEAYPTGLVGHWLVGRLRFNQPTTISHSDHHITPSDDEVGGKSPPHILTCHGTYGIAAREHRLDLHFYRQVLRNAAAICPVSKATADQLMLNFPAELAKTYIRPIHNGNYYYKDIHREEAILREESANPILLTVGDIKPRKGQDISLEAFIKVKRSFPKAEYWIVGDTHPTSPFYQNLCKRVQEEKISGVKFLGHVTHEELQRCYREATVFVLTPRQEGVNFEGFGLVFLEAGAYGLPVVATRSGGVPEAVLDGVPEATGILAEENDPESVAEAILALLENPSLAQKMGVANRERAETLTWESAAKLQVEVYHHILDKHQQSN